jgi:ribonuclease HI
MPRIDIYVDGSYYEGGVGYGAVILVDGQVVQELSGPVPPAKAGTARNVAGELLAVGYALRWCAEQGYREVHLYYDYKGIEHWAMGTWKTKNELTRRYKQFVDQAGLMIHFHKVKAHTGDRWNEHADELARRGAMQAEPLPEADQQGGSTAQHNNAQGPLAQRAERFGRYLADRDWSVRLEGVKNGQFARLTVQAPDTGRRAAFFDLYNTKKKPWTPRIHGPEAERIEGALRSAWEAFRLSDGGEG